MPVIAHSIPDSSSVSRAAAWATDSPRSTAPPGTAQLPLSVRRISRIAPAWLYRGQPRTQVWHSGGVESRVDLDQVAGAHSAA
jgi:hypothetical protein